MQESSTLGLCFSSKQLYYCIKNSKTPNRVDHIGCFDFSFNIGKSIRTQDPETFPSVYGLLGRLKKEYGVKKIRVATVPDHECWTSLPKLVFDTPDEREAHLSIIMKGIPRSEQSISWIDLSNREYKFACIRKRGIVRSYERLSEHVHEAEYISSFELGELWLHHHNDKGSFMMIHSIPGLISISAYLLGKLRGATNIAYDDAEDLPYLWLYYANNLKWLNGMYENVYMFGANVENLIQIIRSNLDQSAHIHRFETLTDIGVTADEQTYGFNLEAAFPAILLSLL